MTRRKRIVVVGFMASCPIAGVIWQHVHYIVGLKRLGHEVYYIEDFGKFPYNPESFDISEDYSHAVKILKRLGETYDFPDRWAFRAHYLPGMPTVGFSSTRIRELYSEADAILNICGAQDLNDDLLKSDRMIYIESDPGVEQIRVDKGEQSTIDYLKHHMARFTFGELVPTLDFPVPLHGLEWKPTRQPVVTDFWHNGRLPGSDAIYTSIANWSTSGQKDIEWRGETYLWSKSMEFLRFIEAPAALHQPAELATDIPDQALRDEFTTKGWRLSSPHQLSVDFDGYREYIRNSRGEFTVAKDQYVRLKTGWFSDRSACYLAAGRPVITQETGFSKIYGGQGGLFGFSTLEDIEAACDEIRHDYAFHCRAAAELAHEVFEAEKVVGQLLQEAGV